MSKPHKCPVCKGNGTTKNNKECHACGGKGIVWEPKPESKVTWYKYIHYYPYQPYIYTNPKDHTKITYNSLGSVGYLDIESKGVQ